MPVCIIRRGSGTKHDYDDDNDGDYDDDDDDNEDYIIIMMIVRPVGRNSPSTMGTKGIARTPWLIGP